jgi:hypothetical protein
MAKRKIEKGAQLICVQCGREIVVSNCGISRTTRLCCGRPMKESSPSLVKEVKEKLAKKKK